MDTSDNENEAEGMRILGPDDGGPGEAAPGGDHGLPHWTEPGTGQVPRMSGPDEDLEAWSDLPSAGPRWADDADPGVAAPPPVAAPTPTDPAPVSLGGAQVEDDFFSYEDQAAAQVRAQAQRRAATIEDRMGGPTEGGVQSDLVPRVATALVLGGAAVLCLILGDGPTMLLIAAILGLAASEFFVSLRKVGYQPATLLGLAACIGLPLAVYWRGHVAFGLVLFLLMLFGALWYLTGVGTERPVPNLGVTALGVVYIGVLGSFAALLLDLPDGNWILFVAILLAVAYDVGGYFIGGAMGRAPLTTISPNKTVEGLLGGVISAIIVAAIVNIVGLGPFDGSIFSLTDTLLIGAAAGLVAPIGDLAESLMKRDLGLKDMGTILPGHGGILDRFDALLFVLPTVYYMILLVV